MDGRPGRQMLLIGARRFGGGKKKLGKHRDPCSDVEISYPRVFAVTNCRADRPCRRLFPSDKRAPPPGLVILSVRVFRISARTAGVGDFSDFGFLFIETQSFQRSSA